MEWAARLRPGPAATQRARALAAGGPAVGAGHRGDRPTWTRLTCSTSRHPSVRVAAPSWSAWRPRPTHSASNRCGSWAGTVPRGPLLKAMPGCRERYTTALETNGRDDEGDLMRRRTLLSGVLALGAGDVLASHLAAGCEQRLRIHRAVRAAHGRIHNLLGAATVYAQALEHHRSVTELIAPVHRGRGICTHLQHPAGSDQGKERSAAGRAACGPGLRPPFRSSRCAPFTARRTERVLRQRLAGRAAGRGTGTARVVPGTVGSQAAARRSTLDV